MKRSVRAAILVGLCSSLALTAHADSPSPRERDDLNEKDRARVENVTRPATRFDKPERFERMSAGATTSTKLINANAFSHSSANLEFAELERFLLGNGLFRKDWVSSPSSTQASDGLGPLFNARACQSCHIKDGRGHAPAQPGDSAVSLLVRLSIAPSEAQKDAIADGRLPAAPDPVYGLQLQDHAVAGLDPEGRVDISYEELPVMLSDGETVTLRKPVLKIADPGYGPLREDLMISARVAPPMIGLGLLESVHEADILAWADPGDEDNDGISGRPARTRDIDGQWKLGRFGWKAIASSIEQQTADAFSGDMGLSTPAAPNHWGDCTQAQTGCLALPHGAQERLGAHEVPDDLFDLVTFYSSHLAVPVRRDVDNPAVLAGKKVFYDSGCAACHRPKYVTRRDVEDPALRFQLIWPYTDMLLHDMGTGLADGRSEGLADGFEWRTPPLWGIGLTATVNAEATFLHDGRARTLLEAVLWHGGEAQAARDRVVEMEMRDRDNLIRFLESL
ncbi:di-heme oxidoredictase family protein [uncultured Nitratireductor sp.]|uniref:di-heme oxidoreductase family protein n=1 Tax=uncultured Nitratireductor sp. TaxID=520953 RepID=UPI0025EFC602|nr:di-heme oxidoredictase family protein [uncultured Nitratireductor sp.]